jgi:hypothetical protein
MYIVSACLKLAEGQLLMGQRLKEVISIEQLWLNMGG